MKTILLILIAILLLSCGVKGRPEPPLPTEKDFKKSEIKWKQDKKQEDRDKKQKKKDVK